MTVAGVLAGSGFGRAWVWSGEDEAVVSVVVRVGTSLVLGCPRYPRSALNRLAQVLPLL